MSSIEWYNEKKTILHWKFQAGATADELVESFKEFNQVMKDVDWVVFTILEFPVSGKIPSGIIARFPELAQLMPRPNSPHGQVGVISSMGVFKKLVEIFGVVYFSRFVFFNSFEEAVADFEAKLAKLASESSQ